MRIECPKGFRSTVKAGKMNLVFTEVDVCGGVCDSADFCKIEDCEFYDVSREGTARFMQAAAEEHTLEGLKMKIAHENAARQASAREGI